MPDQSSNLTAIRSRSGNRSKAVYLSLMTGSVVYSATVNTTPTFPAQNIAITGGSGTIGDVKAGMRVVIETSGGSYKGTLHVRAAGTISAANIPVREFSKGFAQVTGGDTLKVYDDFFITDKLVSADETFAPDGITYSDQGSDPPPVVCSGGWWAGWASNASAVPFIGSASYNLDPDTASTITHLWAEPAGSLSSTTDADITWDLSGESTGRYLLAHTATAVNTKSRTQYVAVRTHDANDMPLLATEESPLTANRNDGWSYSFRLYANASLADIPDGAPVIVWVDETINGSTQSFGNAVSGRSHIKCAGYLRRDRSGFDENERRYYVVFDVVSPLAQLAELPGFSKVLVNKNTPDDWSEVKTLTVKRAMAQLTAFYTNLIEAGFDLIFDSSFSDATYPRFYLQKNTPIGQLRELADSRDCELICDRVGRIQVQMFPPYTPLSDRSSVPVTLPLGPSDKQSYEQNREHYEPVETFRLRGFTSGSNPDPLFAKWPGSAPGMGSQSETVERVITAATGSAGASENYQRCARRGAWNQRVYTKSTGEKYHAPSKRVTLPSSYDVFDLYHEFITDSNDGDLRIGSDSDVFLWFVESITSEFGERGEGRVVLQLQAATNGLIDESEADDTPPTTEDTWPGLGSFSFPDIYFDPFPIASVVPPAQVFGTGSLAFFTSDGKIARTSNFSRRSYSGGPNYDVFDYSASISGTVIAVVLDGNCAYFKLGSGNVDVFIVTTAAQGIYKISGIFQTTPTVTNPTNAILAATGRNIDLGYGANDPNIIAVVSNYTTNGVAYTYSTNGGTTWSAEAYVSGSSGDYSDNAVNLALMCPGLYADPRTSGKFFTCAGESAAGVNSPIYHTTDLSSGWSDYTNLQEDEGYAAGLRASFTGTSTTLYYGFYSNNGVPNNFNRLVRAAIDSSETYINNDYGPDPRKARFLFNVADNNPNKALLAGTNDAFNSRGILTTTNVTAASPTWVELVTPGSSVAYTRGFLTDTDFAIVFGTNGAIGASDAPYTAGTVDDRSGDLVTTAEIIGVVGK